MSENPLNLTIATVFIALYFFVSSTLSSITITAEQGMTLLVSASVVVFMTLVVKVINQPNSK